MSVYADVIRYRELFGSLFRRDLRAKYRGSFLGLGWSLLHPLVLMLVYLLVFSVLWRVAEVASDDYWLFLLCGLPAWVFFATAAQAASRCLLENANLIRKVRFPRQLVPLSIVGTNLVSFAVMLGVVIVLSLWQIPEARDTVWLAIPLGALFACVVAGFALAVASLNALYRDVEHLLQALLLPWFFLTPILYSLGDLPGVDDYPVADFFLHWVNFLTPPIEAMRAVLFYGEMPGCGGHDLHARRGGCRARFRRARVQPLGRPDRDRSLTTARPSKSPIGPCVRGEPCVHRAARARSRSEGNRSARRSAGCVRLRRPRPRAVVDRRAIPDRLRARPRRSPLRARPA